MARPGKPCPHTVPVAALYIEPDGRMFRKKKTGRNRLNDIPSPAKQTGHGRHRERSVHAGRYGRHVALPRIGDQTVPFVQTARLAEAFATDIVPVRTTFGQSGRRPRMPQRGNEEARPYEICEQTLHFRFGRSVSVRCKYNAFCETIRIPSDRMRKNIKSLALSFSVLGTADAPACRNRFARERPGPDAPEPKNGTGLFFRKAAGAIPRKNPNRDARHAYRRNERHLPSRHRETIFPAATEQPAKRVVRRTLPATRSPEIPPFRMRAAATNRTGTPIR